VLTIFYYYMTVVSEMLDMATEGRKPAVSGGEMTGAKKKKAGGAHVIAGMYSAHENF
jgi:hypothetical protein